MVFFEDQEFHSDFITRVNPIRGAVRKKTQLDLLAHGISNVHNTNLIENKKNESEGKKGSTYIF